MAGTDLNPNEILVLLEKHTEEFSEMLDRKPTEAMLSAKALRIKELTDLYIQVRRASQPPEETPF